MVLHIWINREIWSPSVMFYVSVSTHTHAHTPSVGVVLCVACRVTTRRTTNSTPISLFIGGVAKPFPVEQHHFASAASRTGDVGGDRNSIAATKKHRPIADWPTSFSVGTRIDPVSRRRLSAARVIVPSKLKLNWNKSAFYFGRLTFKVKH